MRAFRGAGIRLYAALGLPGSPASSVARLPDLHNSTVQELLVVLIGDRKVLCLGDGLTSAFRYLLCKQILPLSCSDPGLSCLDNVVGVPGHVLWEWKA